MIRLLYGKDEFTISEKVIAMRDQIHPEEMREFNTMTYEGMDLTRPELVNAISVVPFMANTRLVIVKDFLKKFDRYGGTDSLGDWKGIVDDLESISTTTQLLFVEQDLSNRNPMLRFLKKIGNVEYHPLLKSRELTQWTLDRASTEGMSINFDAARYLADAVGPDLRLIDSELKKLHLYNDFGVITIDSVRDMVAQVREQSVFKVVDFVIEGRSKDAIIVASQLLESGSSPSMITRMIERQVRFLLVAKDLKSRDIPVSEFGKRLSLSGYPLTKTLDMEKNISMDRLRLMNDLILSMDLKVVPLKRPDFIAAMKLSRSVTVSKKLVAYVPMSDSLCASLAPVVGIDNFSAIFSAKRFSFSVPRPFFISTASTSPNTGFLSARSTISL